MDKQLARLGALADMIRERELAELAARSEERMRYEEKIRTCRENRARTIAAAALDAAHFAGTDDAWLRWNRRELDRLSVEAAQAAARAETQLRAARRAFGRATALARLADRKNR